MEYFDVLDDKGNQTGEKRVAWKESYAGLWDVSAAGHISAGQTSCEGAVRELEEELGVKANADELEYLFSFETNKTLNNGTFLDHEFLDVYVLRRHVNVDGLILQPEEVESCKWISVDELKRRIEEHDPDIVPCDLSKYPLFEKL